MACLVQTVVPHGTWETKPCPHPWLQCSSLLTLLGAPSPLSGLGAWGLLDSWRAGRLLGAGRGLLPVAMEMKGLQGTRFAAPFALLQKAGKIGGTCWLLATAGTGSQSHVGRAGWGLLCFSEAPVPQNSCPQGYSKTELGGGGQHP